MIILRTLLKQIKNRLVYDFANAATSDIIKITPADNLNTLSAMITDLQAKINKIPSVLNGYTLEIDLSKLTANFSDFNIVNPLIINKFYQGTVKIVGDTNKIIKYTVDTTTSLTSVYFENYLNTSRI